MAGRRLSGAAKPRWREWLARFAPGEIAGLLGSYLGYLAASGAGLPPLAAAYGAALGENVGYYAAVFIRDWYALPAADRRAGPVVRAMLHDFGLAELLDTLLVRPGATVLAVALLGTAWGVGAGKVVADLVFYLIAIAFWERRRRGPAVTHAPFPDAPLSPKERATPNGNTQENAP